MANDFNMLMDIDLLKKLKKFKQAEALQDLFDYKYGFGDVGFTTEEKFEKAKKEYKKKYGFLDNYV